MKRFEELREWIRSGACNLATSPDTALFFSRNCPDYPELWYRGQVAKLSPLGVIEIKKTPGGSELATRIRTALANNEISPREETRLWGEASKRFARVAEGKVIAFVENAHINDTFMRKELPTLLKNPRVTHINGIPRQELEQEVQEKLDNGVHKSAALEECRSRISEKMAEMARQRQEENARLRAFEQEQLRKPISLQR